MQMHDDTNENNLMRAIHRGMGRPADVTDITPVELALYLDCRLERIERILMAAAGTALPPFDVFTFVPGLTLGDILSSRDVEEFTMRLRGEETVD